MHKHTSTRHKKKIKQSAPWPYKPYVFAPKKKI
uniref:Uncharacterized protein n=1 Tax=Arundo donax TaxID=35708 RepID=A0A0A9AID4_ARUDO